MNESLLQEICLLDRTRTDCVKWDGLRQTFGQENLLPVWVADMDFKVPACVRQALHERVDRGAFGYDTVPDAYYDSILGWEAQRHGTRLQREWLRTASGVVTGLYHLLQAVTEPGDGILVQTPVYSPLFRAIRDTGRTLVCNPLVQHQGVYSVDLAAFEKTIVGEKIKFFLLCSPHNPVGRVWTRQELEDMFSCCRRHGVRVLSDEIHHDILMPGQTHSSAVTVWEEGAPILLFSPSKTFNLAGMKNSVLVIPDRPHPAGEVRPV